MRLRLGINEDIGPEAMKEALDAALEASTASQVPLIRRGRIPPFAKARRQYGIQWRPEPPGDEHFDSAATVLRRGWGDCDDLAPWHAASLRASGTDPHADAIVKRSGANKWHAIVRRGDGSIEDPSAAAGMHEWYAAQRAKGVHGAGPAIWNPMFPRRAGVAVAPICQGHACRVDVPDRQGWAWSSVSCSPSKRRSVTSALGAALDIAACGEVDDDDLARLEAMLELVHGTHPDEVADALQSVYGAHVVGFLPALLPAAAQLAAPLLSSFGGGQPSPPQVAPSAALSRRPPMGPGTSMTMPGGTTIVRF